MSIKAKTETHESQHQKRPHIAASEQLDHELDGTFPASDPPSMTQPGIRAGAPDRTDSSRKSSQAGPIDSAPCPGADHPA
jgi:hypothetical protein